MEPQPNPIRVKELLTYNHETKTFKWRKHQLGLRGIDNPENLAGCFDNVFKKKVIRIDQHVFIAEDLTKYFTLKKTFCPRKLDAKKTFKSHPGITWSSDKLSYRIRIYKDKKSYSIGYCNNFIEALFTKLAATQCLEINDERTFNYCKEIMGTIK